MFLYLPFRDEVLDTKFGRCLKNGSRITEIHPYFEYHTNDDVSYELLVGSIRIIANRIDDYI